MYSMDCIDKLGMTLSMKLMRMCGCSGLEKILLNPKSEVRGMYFGTVCSVFGGCQVGSKNCAKSWGFGRVDVVYVCGL